jgi:cbb3-type cytochrome oxidase subunit 3
MPSSQQHSNHARYIPLWHIITSLAILSLLAGSIVNLVNSANENLYAAALLVLASCIFLSIFWYARWFALRAQDRAIRAEENLRHFALTGRLLDSRLRLGQIIALRFASDEEFTALAARAAEEGMRSADIKKAVAKWRADHHRV